MEEGESIVDNIEKKNAAKLNGYEPSKLDLQL